MTQETTPSADREWFARGVEIGLRAALIVAQSHHGLRPVQAEIAEYIERAARHVARMEEMSRHGR